MFIDTNGISIFHGPVKAYWGQPLIKVDFEG